MLNCANSWPEGQVKYLFIKKEPNQMAMPINIKITIFILKQSIVITWEVSD